MHIDRTVERMTRSLAHGMGRRGFISRLGLIIAGGTLPLLPIARGNAAEPTKSKKGFADRAQTKDDTACDYWRYCGIDGSLCSCCGGSPSSCPPGTTASPSSWVGSCRNPDDGKTYLIAYRDCCGKDSCNRCTCLNVEGESPAYRPQLNSDVIWCFGASDMSYHCSSAAIIGEVTE